MAVSIDLSWVSCTSIPSSNAYRLRSGCCLPHRGASWSWEASRTSPRSRLSRAQSRVWGSVWLQKVYLYSKPIQCHSDKHFLFFFFNFILFHFGHTAWLVGTAPWPGAKPRPMAWKCQVLTTGLPANPREELPLPVTAVWVPWRPVFPTSTYLKMPIFHLWFYLFYWRIQLTHSVVLFLLYSNGSVIHK